MSRHPREPALSVAQRALPDRGAVSAGGEHAGAGDRRRPSAAQPLAREAAAPSQSRLKRSDVVIELGRGRRVRVDSNIDTEALGRILDCILGPR